MAASYKQQACDLQPLFSGRFENLLVSLLLEARSLQLTARS